MPDIQSQIIRGHLQNVSVKFTDAELVNTEVFPMLPLPSPKAKILRYSRGDQFRDEAKARARGTEAAISDYKVDTVNADTVQYAFKHRITDEDIRDSGLPNGMSPPINMIQDCLERNARKLDLRREKAVAAAILTPVTPWADGNADGQVVAGGWLPTDATNTFLSDISTAKKSFVKNGVGVSRLRLLVDYATFEALKRVAEIRDQLKYTSNQSLSEDSLAKLLGIDKVIVAQGISSTAKEKKDGTDFTGAAIWEKVATKGSAFIYWFPAAPGLKTMAAGYQPQSKMPNGEYRLSESNRRAELHAWEYESQEEVGITVVAPQAGYLYKNTLLA